MSKFITREALKGMIDRNDDFNLVDVLGCDSYECEHIPGSINIPVEDIEEKAGELLDEDKDIVVYCGNSKCTASLQAAEKLMKLGYKKVYDYEGGLQDWQDAGFLLVSAKHAGAVA